MRKILKRVPGVPKLYRQIVLLKIIAQERWFADRRLMNDRSHLTGEWNFGSLANEERYERALRLVARSMGTDYWGDVLEVGCASGLFTERLAERCQSLTANDISPVACARTAERLSKYTHLRVENCDLDFDPIAGCFDVVFAMDVLEFIHGRDRLDRVGRKLAGAVRSGGVLILSACRLPEGLRRCWWSPIFPEGADNIVNYFSLRFGLRLVHKEIHSVPEAPDYVEHIMAAFKKT